MLRKISYITVVVLATCPVHAADWVTILKNDNVTALVDRESISQKGGYVKAWSKLIYAKPPDSASEYYLVRSFSVIHCHERSMAWIQVLTYAKDVSQLVNSYSRQDPEPTDFNVVIADMPAETILNYVCVNSGKAK